MFIFINEVIKNLKFYKVMTKETPAFGSETMIFKKKDWNGNRAGEMNFF